MMFDWEVMGIHMQRLIFVCIYNDKDTLAERLRVTIRPYIGQIASYTQRLYMNYKL